MPHREPRPHLRMNRIDPLVELVYDAERKAREQWNREYPEGSALPPRVIDYDDDLVVEPNEIEDSALLFKLRWGMAEGDTYWSIAQAHQRESVPKGVFQACETLRNRLRNQVGPWASPGDVMEPGSPTGKAAGMRVIGTIRFSELKMVLEAYQDVMSALRSKVDHAEYRATLAFDWEVLPIDGAKTLCGRDAWEFYRTIGRLLHFVNDGWMVAHYYGLKLGDSFPLQTATRNPYETDAELRKRIAAEPQAQIACGYDKRLDRSRGRGGVRPYRRDDQRARGWVSWTRRKEIMAEAAATQDESHVDRQDVVEYLRFKEQPGGSAAVPWRKDDL